MLLFLLISFSFSDIIDDIGDLWSGINKVYGPTGIEVLQLDMDAMTNSMAGNYWDKGVHAVMYNPSEMLLNDNSSYYDITFTHRKLACGMMSDFVGVSRPLFGGAVGFSLLGFFSGDIDLRGEIPGDVIGSYSSENFIAGFTYNRIYKDLSLGGTVRYIHERIFSDSYSTYSFDLGISRELIIREKYKFRMIIAFLHLGPKYHNKEFRLPSTWRLALKTSISGFRGGVSIVKPLNTEIQSSIGAEYVIGMLSLRFGKKYGNPLEKYSLGFGLEKMKFSFDYSYSPTDNGYEGSHLITASVKL